MSNCTCDFRSSTIAASPYGEPTRDVNCATHGDAAFKARARARLLSEPIQDRLRRMAAAHPFWVDITTEAADRFDAIDALHYPDTDGFTNDWCTACAHPWPCPTYLLVHPKVTQ